MKRLLRNIGIALIATAATGGSVWLLRGSELTRCHTVDVEGVTSVDPVEIRHLANVGIGLPLVSVDLDAVVAGVERSVRRALGSAALDAIGIVAGNHDRSGWTDLHRAAWPLVAGWIDVQQMKAIERLDSAKSQRRYAGGVDEVWTMAMEGRIELVVVEDTYAVAARVLEGHLQPTDQVEAPDVVDDVVDEIIEAVLRHGGGAVVVGDGRLGPDQRIAAVARY